METPQQKLLNEEPSVVLDNFIGGKISIVSLLDVQRLSPQQLMIGFTLIHKACLPANDMNLVANFLCDLASCKDHFITAVSILVGKELSGAKTIDNNLLEITVDLLHILAQRVPSASINILEILLPQLSAVCIKWGDKEHIINKLKELEKQTEACVAAIQKKEESSKHVAAPCDFRLLPNIPSNDKMFSGKPFLRPAIIDGPFENVEHYLDVHFRLMREDMFRNFRKCLEAFHFEKDLENGRLYRNAHLDKIEQTNIGIFLHFVVPISTKVDWKTTKHLTPGSLLCISCDGFKSFHFGSIHSRRDDGKQGNVCYLALSFESMKEPRCLLALYDILEAGGYYEAYSHVFENLKNLNYSSFPFKNCLIDYEGCNDIPFSLDCEQEIHLKDFQCDINDNTQTLAFELALRNKIALIQGPPGTGKSYLGVQIARYLTQIVHNQKPLIVMCYTNHSLDQFLEKMLDFTRKIVRIGGRSQSEKLKPHNLSNLIRSYYHPPQTRKYDYLDYFDENNNDDDDEVLNKSLNIVYELHGDDMYTDFTSHLYGRVKRRSGILSKHIDYFIKHVKYPFTTTTINVTLSDILGLRDILTSGKLKGNIFNAALHTSANIKLYHWLMIDRLFCNIYDEMTDFKQMLTEELINAFHLRSILEKEKNPSQLESLAKLLIKLCIKQRADFFFNQHNTSGEVVEYFVQKHLHSNENAFPLFFRAAIRYTEKNDVVIDSQCNNLWKLDLKERWKLLSLLLFEVSTLNISRINEHKIFHDERKFGKKTIGEEFTIHTFESELEELKYKQIERNAHLLQGADIIGITTTGAAKNFDLLKKIKPTTYIAEEAAEVFESHIVASLVSDIEHLVLIGDHFQLRPSPTVYDLAIKYHLDVSLFERLFKNGVPSVCLKVQHRMRPCIAKLLIPEFYQSLENHPSVLEYENIAGISSNIFFLNHSELENAVDDLKSHSNSYEALLIVTLCEYLIREGHKPSSITILTTYVGQLYLIRRNMQGKESVKHVLATTVDNYQGEENDIILVSFVRSNTANKVGFIKTHNRLCVALSRARKGLYCIGNFDMFASQSKIWQSLLTKLSGLGSLGEKMEVNCHKHPKLKYLIGTPSDLKNHMKRGCHNPCCELLLCGHNCALSCHGKKTEHRGKLCNSGCMQKMAEEFQVIESSKNEKEIEMVTQISDKIIDSIFGEDKDDFFNTRNRIHANSFRIEDECHADFNYNNTSEVMQHATLTENECNPSSNVGKNSFPKCDTVVLLNELQRKNEHTRILPCGHAIKSYYSIFRISGVKCHASVISHMKCGENINHICGEEINHQNCSSPLLLQCGHTVPCNTNVDLYVCHQTVKNSLKCGHVMSVPCHESKLEDMKCTVKINVILPCSHPCTVPCSKNSSLNLIKCIKPCGLLLPCNHKCLNTCNHCSSSGKHKISVSLIEGPVSSGHVFEVKCSSPLALCHQRCMYRCVHTQCFNPCYVSCIPCKKPCTWNCEHYHCENLCSDLCDRPPCEKSCPKLNPCCGHPCSGFCGEPCPILCQQCKSIVGVDNEKFILLEDCGHSIPHVELTSFLMKQELQDCPRCPKCDITITKNVHFGNLLKTYYNSRNEITSKNIIKFPLIQLFQPYVSTVLFKEHLEMIWNELKMGDPLEWQNYHSRLKLVRQLSVLFCMNEFGKKFETFKDSQKLYDSMKKDEAENIDTRASIFRNGALLFILNATAEKKAFSKIKRINEICEDVMSSLEKSPFDTEIVETVVKIVNIGSNMGCPTLNAFLKFLKELCLAIA